MRDAAKSLMDAKLTHGGLLYQLLADTTDDEKEKGKVPTDKKGIWFKRLSEIKPTADYQRVYDDWLNTLRLDCSTALATNTTPLLLGVGQPSASEVGLTIHPLLGVPYLPGTSLKGVLAHYLMATYGPEELGVNPHDPQHPEPDRAPYQGVSWDGTKIKHGPGAVYRALFGAPEADHDKDFKGDNTGATVGRVIFHDALMVPLAAEDADGPFVRDVVNPHLNSYYQKDQDPNDHDSPVPVFFLAVRSGLKFHIALGGDGSLHKLTHKLLQEALAEWGIGAKTRAGYGRLSLMSLELTPEEQLREVERAREEEARQQQEELNKARQERAQLVQRYLITPLQEGSLERIDTEMKPVWGNEPIPELTNEYLQSPQEADEWVSKHFAHLDETLQLDGELVRSLKASSLSSDNIRLWLMKVWAHQWGYEKQFTSDEKAVFQTYLNSKDTVQALPFFDPINAIPTTESQARVQWFKDNIDRVISLDQAHQNEFKQLGDAQKKGFSKKDKSNEKDYKKWWDKTKSRLKK